MPRKTFEIAVADLAQAIGLLVRRVRAAPASHELSLTEGAVMKRLATDGPATTAELARAESMKPQSMGTTIAALEEMGMVARKPHPADGRQRRRRAQEHPRCKTGMADARRYPAQRERKTLFAAGEIIKRPESD
jgi:DNA-binding transcriptional ArsR family regulator